MSNLIGQSLGRYQILELLGQGGMAMVYKAYDTRLEREVAIKIIRSEAFPPEELHDVLKRFEREAKALAQLSHPNIVKVMDFGEYEGSPFLVMEYLPGGTLKHLIGEPMSWQEAIRLLLPVARGLEYAHYRGIVHRDIKPANILLTENSEPILSDFGIVKLLQGDKATTLTGSGIAIGTPEYMAPEQWTGGTSPKSDMYSLGVVLYEIITGQRPYDADTPGGLFLKQMTEPLPQPRDIVSNLPESVERFLLKALAKEPSERYDNLGIFIKELENLLTDHRFQERSVELKSKKSIKVPKVDADRKAPSMPRINRRWVSVAVMAVVLSGIVLGGVIGLPLLTGQPVDTPEPTLTPTKEEMPEITPTKPITVTPEPSSLPTEIITLTATPLPTNITDDFGVEMILIPAGEFKMGFDQIVSGWALSYKKIKQTEDAHIPEHDVYLDSYYIDKYEVTNALYQECVNAEVCAPPVSLSSHTRNSYYDNPEYADYPVIFVSQIMASAYCEWRGVRLPTEAEWEKAARGTDGRIFAWGSENPFSICEYANVSRNGICEGDTTKVGSYPSGQSFYGVYDMTGNVWEWVSDWFDKDYYDYSPKNNPQGPEQPTGQVTVRGGGWSLRHPPDYANHTYLRNLLLSPDATENDISIRCAMDAE